jgi:hypothetical protein
MIIPLKRGNTLFMKQLSIILLVSALAMSMTACGAASQLQSAAVSAPNGQPATAQPTAPVIAPTTPPTAAAEQAPSLAPAPTVSGPETSNASSGPDPKNATILIDGKPVTLVNGLSEEPTAPGSATKIVTRYFGNDASGDLNGDGKPDVAFLITQDPGGSGTFFYVAAVYSTDHGYQGTNAVLLGDRVAPQNTLIQDGKIVVNYADRKPTDPMSAAPSVGVSKYLVLKDGSLVEP